MSQGKEIYLVVSYDCDQCQSGEAVVSAHLSLNEAMAERAIHVRVDGGKYWYVITRPLHA